MKTRTVELVVSPPSPHFVGDGFRVHNFIPSAFRMDMKRMDPFIMMDYNSKFVFPPANHPKGEVLKQLHLLTKAKLLTTIAAVAAE